MAESTNRSRTIALIRMVLIASLVISGIQLLLGGNPGILALVFLSGAVCLWPVYLYGIDRTIGILYLMVWFTFSFGALAVKTILLQTIDSNLFSPLLTHLILLAGSAAFSLAAVAAYYVKPLQRDAIKVVLDPRYLSVIATLFLVFGMAGVFSMGMGKTMAAIGVFLRPFLFYSFVCATSAILISSGGKKSFSILSVVDAILIIVLSVSFNSKAGILTVSLAYILCLFAFGVRPRFRTIAAISALGIFCSVALFPAIHIVRSQRERISGIELTTRTAEATMGLLIGDQEYVAQKDRLSTEIGHQGYNLYRNLYFGSQQVWLDRFMATGFVDALTRRVTYDGPFFGPSLILSQTLNVLPRQLNDQKGADTMFSGGAQITRLLGMSNRDAAVFPTVPLPIELFVAGGFPMIFIIGFPTIIACLIAINFLAYNYRYNVWSVCLIVNYGYFFSINTYILYVYLLFRQLPVDYMLISLSILAASTILGRASSAPDGARPSTTPAASAKPG